MKAIVKLLFIVTLLLGACKEEEPPLKEDLYPDTPLTTPSASTAQLFYKNQFVYEIFVYRFDPILNKWTDRIRSHFPLIPTNDPTVLGFANPYAPDSGVALFDMVRLYSTQIASPTNNIRTAKINVERALQFFPDFEGAKTGVVKVIPQDVIITKNPNSTFEPGIPTFKIGISGSGTYDERTKIINLEVIFDETNIGGPSAVKRRYTMSVEEQTLN